jgi:hypothetical protein
MNEIPSVTVHYIKDESIQSKRRTDEAVELIFQMLLLARKRGRPAKKLEEEDYNAA